MKNIIFKKQNDLKKRLKSLSLSQTTEDKDCLTEVIKSFEYKVEEADEMQQEIKPPEVYIKKYFNTQSGIERVDFEVQGSFYLSQNRFLYRVKFHHILNIQITWKNKIFSPKKSAVLT